MSTPVDYYERYWSEGGYRPLGSLSPVLQNLFEAHVSLSARCLDLGCGDGRTAGLWLSERGAAYVGVVVCIEVLEHLLEPQLAAAEALRVLRSGGVFLISVPNVAYWRRRLELGLLGRWNPFGDDLSTREPWRDPHIRFFTPKTLRRMLEHRGFTDVETRGICGSFLAELPGIRRFVGSKTSASYGALERAAPTLFGARIQAVARKRGATA